MYNNNTKAPWKRYALSMVATMLFTLSIADTNYRFLNNKTSTTLKFKLINNLIVIPVKVNGMDLNLILDTGMRSVVLFGKKYTRRLEVLDDVTVRLSGYGKKKNRPCKLSLDNDLQIQDVLGQHVSIVIMPSPDLFEDVGLSNIDGIIGYEIFSRFIVRIDYPGNQITLFEPYAAPPIVGFETLPLTIKDTKPYIPATLIDDAGQSYQGQFHVDTGSSQDIMMFLREEDEKNFRVRDRALVGVGIGGNIKGFVGEKSQMHLGNNFSKEIVPKYIQRLFSNRELQDAKGSIGSGFLKHNVVILDYINMTFHLRKSGAVPHKRYPQVVAGDI
ncbi:hypothetical protein E1176_18280 [Fulvivirga sp. RKSG066]|uniref:aspartyl protease family protein n=1 Tax=Fulvivirga aurantia TaxID=2529383 RepID=UPI0012BBF16C|nr:aspartyl protease family protein [Fulvivirga aurantia]MTI22984.1 hypothetical protein [Fulvivirga aurantia]